ncbi:MAG: CRISPR-associated protein Cas5 [Clostridiales bacterium]|nr:CRISPR-associated protein Cas5 [Clostridiales bacterium]
MLKAVRVIAYQNMANYRRPTAIAVQDSFKLPPYSTVIGLIHTACGFTEYHPMKISIVGSSKSSLVDMYTRYYHSGMKLEMDRHQLYVENNPGNILGGYAKPTVDANGKIGITRSLGYAQLMVDVELAIYIVPDNPDELEVIKYGLLNPVRYPALGRHEDILRIDNVEIVTLCKQSDDEEESIPFSMAYDALIPLDVYDELELNSLGTIYNMNKVFQIDKAGKETSRKIVERVKAKLIKGGTTFTVNALYDTYLGKKIGVFMA